MPLDRDGTLMTIRRKYSLKAALLGLAGAITLLLPVAAQAAEGFATANVNMRSGPSTNYPAVTVIPVGTSVEIHGCLPDLPWCDVSFYDGRGWVAGRYVQAVYQQRRVYLEPDYYDNLGIPLVTFEIGNYWERYYRNRDFYRDRDRYRDRDYYRRDRDRYTSRPRQDYNTFDRPRYNRDNQIILERPRDRDRDRERIERRRDDNARQNRFDQENRRERDRERIERRTRDSDQIRIDRDNRRERVERRNRDNDQRIERRERNRERNDDNRRIQRRDDNPRDGMGDNIRRRPCDRPGNNNCE
ncbi:SH3 domain-containing protein [Pararhizobium sp. BT-229]|uniref:SH3 domain-containing protein n=1 Tax=Pararhizobium sp. BT-229 TaxID=2986923 RepID=UPI0021F76927|nr:SH3 domain-containing protein [Pararhizobium sp. BT-229]MCV9963441.1 SH3 domain-containing protein [Pararhizobium sp. BT-229]